MVQGTGQNAFAKLYGSDPVHRLGARATMGRLPDKGFDLDLGLNSGLAHAQPSGLPRPTTLQPGASGRGQLGANESVITELMGEEGGEDHADAELGQPSATATRSSLGT